MDAELAVEERVHLGERLRIEAEQLVHRCKLVVDVGGHGRTGSGGVLEQDGEIGGLSWS